MEQNFTKNQLLLFIYKETSASTTLAIQEALNEDWNLYEQYTELLQGYQQLPKVKFNPSKSTLNSILGYSQNSAMTLHH